MGIINTLFASDIPVNDATITLDNPKYASLFGSIRTFAGLNVTPQKAIRCGTVLACVRTIVDDVCTMPLSLLEQTVVNGRRKTSPALDEPLYSILKDMPNDEMTSIDMRAANMLDILMWGGYFNQVIRQNGQVEEIYPLCAANVVSRRDGNGQLVFDYTLPDGGRKTFTKDQVWRCQYMGFNGIDGQSMMLLVREAIGTLLAAEMQSGRLFSTSAQINSVLKIPKDVDIPKGVQLDQIVDEFNARYSGTSNSMKTALLPYGIEIEKLSLTADEAQHIERQKASIEDIVRSFGGGALMARLGIGDKNSYASVAAFLDDYYGSVLTPFTTRIEQSITRDLLLPSERGRLYAKHNHDARLRGDIKSRYEAYGTAIDKGFMTPNRVLELEDENTVEGLDYYHVNPNAIVVDGEIRTVGTSGAQAAETRPAQVPNAAATETKLKSMADAGAERILRAEKKSQKFDAEFVVAALPTLSFAKAQAYCEARKDGSIKEEDAKAHLVALVLEN